MSLFLVDNLIDNTYGTGGTNKPSGFKAGDFMIPGQVNRGVAITNAFPGFLTVLPSTTILTYMFTANTPSTLSLNLLNIEQTNVCDVVYFASEELALKLISPTTISASADNFGYSINVSGYDQYEQKTFSSKSSTGSSNEAVTNVCFNYVTNITISLNTPLSGDQTNTVTINIGGNVELPYTDYGNRDLLLNVVDLNTLPNSTSVPFITVDGAEADFTASFAFGYITSNWSTPITASTGTPRPILTPNQESETNNIILVAEQVIFPTNNFPSLKASPIAFSEDSLTNVIGIKNYTQGWLPWDGGSV